MTEQKLEVLFQEIIEIYEELQEEEANEYNDGDISNYEPTFASVMTFEEKGVLTNNRGLAIKTRDGKEFQVTIVRSQ